MKGILLLALMGLGSLFMSPNTYAHQKYKHLLDEELYVEGYEEVSCLECTFPHWEDWIETVAAGGRAKCTFPIAGGGKVISRFGDARDGGRRRHMGVDIKAPSGRSVVAAWGGKVVSAGYHRRAGYAVKILHPNGYVTYYAHLRDTPAVRKGQKVASGQHIGRVGMTGNARGTTPHLHFEIHTHKGRVLNPISFIR